MQQTNNVHSFHTLNGSLVSNLLETTQNKLMKNQPRKNKVALQIYCKYLSIISMTYDTDKKLVKKDECILYNDFFLFLYKFH